MIEKNQGTGNPPIRHKLEFISTNIAEFLDNFTKITDSRLAKVSVTGLIQSKKAHRMTSKKMWI